MPRGIQRFCLTRWFVHLFHHNHHFPISPHHQHAMSAAAPNSPPGSSPPPSLNPSGDGPGALNGASSNGGSSNVNPDSERPVSLSRDSPPSGGLQNGTPSNPNPDPDRPVSPSRDPPPGGLPEVTTDARFAPAQLALHDYILRQPAPTATGVMNVDDAETWLREDTVCNLLIFRVS